MRVSRALVAAGALGLLVAARGRRPLAALGALAVAYQLHSKRVVGWTIAGVSLAAGLALFFGSLVFAASGRSFEELKGM